MPIIMTNVSRSRRIWMNSLPTIVQNRRQLNSCSFTAAPPFFPVGRRCCAAKISGQSGSFALPDVWEFSLKIVLCRFHQTDEHVLQPGFDWLPVIRAGHPGTDSFAQSCRVASAHMQRCAKRDDLFHAGLAADF